MSKAELMQWVQDNYDREYIISAFELCKMIEDGDITNVGQIQQNMVEL